MTSIFAEVVNMSSMAIWLIFAVIVVRFLCRRITKNLCYLLWALVGIRLLCPFAIESPWSMIPNKTSFEKFVEVKENIQEEFDIHYTENGKVVEDFQNKLEQSVEKIEETTGGLRPIEIVTTIWLAGLVVVLGYTVVNFIKLKKKVAVSVRKKDDIWICDAIYSPFVFGIFRPRIYVPSKLPEEHLIYIVAHEKSHLEWKDHIWKLVGIFVLAMHWFNPLVWIAYILLCRDIELACDERVIKTMDEEEKQNYVKSLLLCSSPIQFTGLGSVAFGEISILKRIKGVLNYKEASFWSLLTVIVICFLVVVCFMTNPKGQAFASEVEKEIQEELVKSHSNQLVIYETTADLNHDGIDDLIQVVRTAYGEFGYEKIDYPSNSFNVRVYLGKKNGGYSSQSVKSVNSETNLTMLWNIWIGNNQNGLYAITKYDGKEYLLYAHVCEYEGNARYRYDIVGISGNIVKRIEGKNLTFACDPFSSQWDSELHREDVVPEFKEGISPWLENAKIIFCSDENGVYVAENGKEKSAKAYFDLIWQRSDVDEIAEYESLPGEERWEKIIHRDSKNADSYILWINQLASSDLSKWFEDYNGDKLQRINHHADGSSHCSLSTCCDVIYHKKGDVQKTLIKMFWEMEEGKNEKGINCTYDIYAFSFSEQPVVQITENMWLVCYFNGYYGYIGVDSVTYEERIASITDFYDFDNGLVSLPRNEEASKYWFILLEKDGVYRLERMENMMER